MLVLAACGRSDRTGTPSVTNAQSATSDRGPDQLVLRFSREGGRVRAFAYPRLDSLVWRSPAVAPPLARILAFDDNAGAIAALDGKDVPVRIDLRLGAIKRELKPKLTRVASTDGWAIYGVSADGSITRLTPSASAPWTFKPASLPRELIPQPDGTLLVLSDKGANTTITQLHPPETRITGTAILPRVQHAVLTPVGDRLYFAVDSGLIGVRSRDLVPVPSVRLESPVRAVVTTPSGDRVYIATGTSSELIVVDRYSENVESRIRLPGPATDVRMDPTGRYVLARSASGDSAWVIAVGTDRVIGSVQSEWRGDLPAVAPDGAIVLLRGKDVHLVDGETLRPSRSVDGGGTDLWHFISWNGFRPRTATADDPSPIAGAESVPDDAAGSGNPFAGQLAGTDTSQPLPQPLDEPSSTRPAGGDSAPSPNTEFTVQFAALRDESAARELAHGIRIGQAPPIIVATTRVLTSVVSGSNIYRVIAGPFRTREEAERASRETGKAYWIYEGRP